jgi:hypothetical protein
MLEWNSVKFREREHGKWAREPEQNIMANIIGKSQSRLSLTTRSDIYWRKFFFTTTCQPERVNILLLERLLLLTGKSKLLPLSPLFLSPHAHESFHISIPVFHNGKY